MKDVAPNYDETLFKPFRSGYPDELKNALTRIKE